MIKNKRAQEEIVGFVLIMVIVAIAILVFLGIALRKPSVDARESSDVFHFLESGMQYTTDCAIRFVPDYSDAGDLLRECKDKRNCLDGRSACEVLNSTMKNLIENGWNPSQDSPIKGYEFSSSYVIDGEQEETLISLSMSNCSGKILGSTYLVPSFPGRIVSELKICY